MKPVMLRDLLVLDVVLDGVSCLFHNSTVVHNCDWDTGAEDQGNIIFEDVFAC